MRNKEKIIEEFCKISNVVAKNLRKVKTFDSETMESKNLDEFLICDCFCKTGEGSNAIWKKHNKVDGLVLEFIKRAVEDKILELDIRHELRDLD